MRGAETSRIDAFAREGLQLWHYIAEPQCTPSRSALMTGPAMRSVPVRTPSPAMAAARAWWPGSGPSPMFCRRRGMRRRAWVSGISGRRTVGGRPITASMRGTGRRAPTTSAVGQRFLVPAGSRPAVVHARGNTRRDGVRRLDDEPLTLERRRDVDVEYKRRAVAFLEERSVGENRPFYLYFNHSLLHVPTVPRTEFQGATGNGDWGRLPRRAVSRLRRPAGHTRRARRRRGDE